MVTLALVLLVAGCGSAEPKYYTLTPWPGTPQGGGPLTVEVETPVVADYLNRDDIVLDNRGYQLHLARNAAWAEPLPGAIGSNLALDLSQRLPGSNVYAANGGISSTAEAVVAVNVSRFAEDDAGRAEITAMVSVHRPHGPIPNIRPLHVVTPLNDRTMGALVALLSQLLGQVADEVAIDLRALGPTQPGTARAGRAS
ncbi:PqiC family protein [Rhodopila sp.]|uniref:PqiC family protein n=1 Tax=Rhodopila sp. TaxID=2480087 RepID=UPI003D11FBE2